MILNISGRTDIIAFYSKWFKNRYKEGFVIIADIKKISELLGKENIYVRYDPILLNEKYNIEYHIKAFTKICTLLDGYINKFIISFIDDYKNVRKNMNILRIKNFTNNDFKVIGTEFSKIAKEHHMTVQTCSEYNNLSEYGFIIDDCISKKLAKEKTVKSFPKWQARNNKYCHCVAMTDIGAYNTCNHLCKYCYANYDESKIKENMTKHNPNSSLLIGDLLPNDEIKIKNK